MMIKRWWGAAFSDDVFRRLLRNVTYLFSAHVLVAVIGLLTLAVLARALGPAGLGVIALIEAYIRTVDRIFRFEPWQAVVRYGAIALENGREDDFRRLTKFATLFDLFGASLGALAALGAAKYAASWLGLDDDQTRMAMWFSATLAFSLSSTPTAILRLFDKFGLIAKMSAGLACTRLFLMVLVWQLGGGLWSFVIVLMLYQIAEQLTPLALAWRELRRQGYVGVWRTPLRGLLAENPGLPRFVWNSNINVMARTSTNRFDTLILGALLDPAAVGLYQLAKRTGLAALRLGRPIQQAVYPDVARLWARGEVARFRSIVLRVNGVMGALGAVAFVVIVPSVDILVRLAFGSEFAAAAPLIIVQVLAVMLFLAGNTFNPALLSIGADRSLIRVTLTATIVFFAAFVPFVHQFGLVGASLSHVAFNFTWLVGCLSVFLYRTRPAIPAMANPGKPCGEDQVDETPPPGRGDGP